MSSFDTLVNVAAYLEARGARKRLDGVAADSSAQLMLVRRVDSTRARLAALRQTMFDARVEAERSRKRWVSAHSTPWAASCA